MLTSANKLQKKETRAAANAAAAQCTVLPGMPFTDNRPESVQQANLQEVANNCRGTRQHKSTGQYTGTVAVVQRAAVIQRAKKGELKEGDIVEFNDDGVILRGRFKNEKEEEHGLYGEVRVTHENNAPLEEEFDYEFTLEKISLYAGPPPVRKIPAEGVTITHFNNVKGEGPKGSEYIRPHKGAIRPENKIVITNHGLGSGIYGVAGMGEEAIAANALEHSSDAHTIRMRNPFFIQDALHGAAVTELSKTMQRVADEIRTEFPGLVSHYGVSDWVEENGGKMADLLQKLKIVMVRVDIHDVSAAMLEDSLFDFFVAYNMHEVVEQPINFLLKKLGHDGIYSDNPSDNAFSRGNVAFNLPEGAKKNTHVSRI